MAIRVTCIRKAGGDHENPYVAIESMNWINDANNKSGTITREDMHDWVKGGGAAYVADSRGNTAYLVAMVSPKGTKYVKTEADDVKSDNLLKLQECFF